MSSQFSSVAVVARRKRKDIAETVLAVEKVLKAHQLNVVFEDVTAGFLGADIKREVYPRADLPNHCDLIVVVGGDGSILGVGRDIAASGVPVLGVNRGGLGFLAGVSPARLDEQISSVLAGKFVSEKHFLLHAKIVRGDEVLAESTALNDIVVHPGSMAYMIDFGLWVDDQFVYDQRSDGVIIASPTGSTPKKFSNSTPDTVAEEAFRTLKPVPVNTENCRSSISLRKIATLLRPRPPQ